MRKVIVEAEITLDGVMGGEAEFWGELFKYHDAGVTEYLKDLLFAPEALLMGRKTYESFAQVWPSRTGELADRINRMPKHVASRSLRGSLTWNATLIEGDIAEEIGRLKQQPGRDLLQYGVGELTRTMLQRGLLDELRLLVYPVVYGRGPRAFDAFDTGRLKLLDTHTFSSGVVALHYRPTYE